MLTLFLKKVTPSCPQKTIALLFMDLSFKMIVQNSFHQDPSALEGHHV